MPKITMKDTTGHVDHGALLKGETYDVSDELAERLIGQGLAEKPKAAAKDDHPKADTTESHLDKAPKGSSSA